MGCNIRLHVAAHGAVQLSIAAFLFGSAAGQLFYGPLADRFGRRRPLISGLAQEEMKQHLCLSNY